MYALRAPHAFDGRRFLPDGATVVVDGDRLVGVEAGRVELPADVEVREHDGTLLPGLFDCHTHLVADSTVGGLERAGAMTDDAVDAVILDSLRAQVAAGVTTVRDLGDRGYRTLGHRDHGGLPRVVAAGPPITTPSGHCHFLGGAVDGDLEAAVAERADRGVDVVKVMASGGFATPGTDQLGAQFSEAELRLLVEAAHDRGLPLIAHAHSLIGIENALAAGVDGIEHFSGLSPDGIRIDDDLLEAVAARGVVVGLTMGNDRALHAAMPSLPPPLVALMAQFGVESFDDLCDRGLVLCRRLREHGVAAVAGVDSGMGPPKAHGNAWRVVAELVASGWPAAEALTAATSDAAAACGLAGETGRLAPGYAADVLLVDGDVSADIGALARPREVLVRGVAVAAVPAPGTT